MDMIVWTLQPWPPGRYTRHDAPGACVRNAWLLASERPDELRLVKGYARIDGAWLGHWWCIDPTGGVVDPSWAQVGATYVGIEIVNMEEIARELLESGFFDTGLHEGVPHQVVDALDAAVYSGYLDVGLHVLAPPELADLLDAAASTPKPR